MEDSDEYTDEEEYDEEYDAEEIAVPTPFWDIGLTVGRRRRGPTIIQHLRQLRPKTKPRRPNHSKTSRPRKPSPLRQRRTKRPSPTLSPTQSNRSLQKVISPSLRQGLISRVGILLSRYKAGKLPKAFKIIPSTRNWEAILMLTSPQNWTPHATYEATRLFVSNLDSNQAQR